MDVYNFQFVERYHGFWRIKGDRGKSIYGILTIVDDNISLELVGQNLPAKQIHYSFINEIRGYAFYKDNDKNRHGYHFILKELEYRTYSVFGDHMTNATYDVNYLYVSDRKNYKTEKILSCCVRNGIMDSWVSNITIKSCNFDFDKIHFEYQQSKPMNLFRSNDKRVYLYFGYDYNYPDKKGFRLNHKTFLNIEFEKQKSFYDSLRLSSSIHWFFALLWNNTTPPDYFCFRTREGQFIFKESNKHSNKYTHREYSLRTDINDYPEDMFPHFFEKWFQILKSNFQPIESFFETFENEYMNPSSMIKNYLTVMDGMIPNEKTEKIEVVKGCSVILDKVSTHISKKEIKLLRNLFYKPEPFTLKEKIDLVLGNLNSYVDINKEVDFSTKVVNTRNVLTHPHKRTNNVYSKEQYRDLAYCLESLIKAFLLLQISIPSEIARKTIGKITCPQ